MRATPSPSRHAMTAVFATLGPEGPAFRRQADHRDAEVRAVFEACRQPGSRQGGKSLTLHAILTRSPQALTAVFVTLEPEGPAFKPQAQHRGAKVRAVFAARRQPVLRQGGKSLTMCATLTRSRHALTAVFATLGPEGPAFRRQADHRDAEVRAVFAACRKPVS